MWYGERIISWPDSPEDPRTHLPTRKHLLTMHAEGLHPLIAMLAEENDLNGEDEPALVRVGQRLLEKLSEPIPFPLSHLFPVMLLGEQAFIRYEFKQL